MGGRGDLDSGCSEADIHETGTEGAGDGGRRRHQRGGGGGRVVEAHHADGPGSENTRQLALPGGPEEAAAAALEMPHEQSPGVLHASGSGVGVQTRPMLRRRRLGD